MPVRFRRAGLPEGLAVASEVGVETLPENPSLLEVIPVKPEGGGNFGPAYIIHK
jgi:hypothetical protein